MEYFNQNDAHLMIWETDTKKRAINNEIKFNLLECHCLSVGDRIMTGAKNNPNGMYTIDEIVEVRKSSLSGYNYCTAKTTYKSLN